MHGVSCEMNAGLKIAFYVAIVCVAVIHNYILYTVYPYIYIYIYRCMHMCV